MFPHGLRLSANIRKFRRRLSVRATAWVADTIGKDVPDAELYVRLPGGLPIAQPASAVPPSGKRRPIIA